MTRGQKYTGQPRQGADDQYVLPNFYYCFIPWAACLPHPLHHMCDHLSPSADVSWDDETLAAFTTTKDALTSASQLAHPRPDAPLALRMDTSNHGIGVVLEQEVKGKWFLLPSSVMACLPRRSGMAHLTRNCLLGTVQSSTLSTVAPPLKEVGFFCDLHPLVQSLLRTSDPWSLQQQHHVSSIAEFILDTVHQPGKFNSRADALLRPPSLPQLHPSVTLGIEYQELAIQ